MGFIERGREESLAEHMLKNADALGADADQVSRLRLAFRLSQGTNAQKAEGGDIAAAVRRELNTSLTQLIEGLRERGETVGRFNDAGAARRKTGDGIGLLVDSGGLTALQAKAALAFRLSYEGCAPTLGSCLGRAGEGRGARAWGDNPFYVNDEGNVAIIKGAISLHRAHLMVQLNKMERAVAEILVDGRELHVLRLVAGEGQTLRQVAGGGGRAAVAYRDALVRALDAIVSALRITEH